MFVHLPFDIDFSYVSDQAYHVETAVVFVELEGLGEVLVAVGVSLEE